MIYEVKKKTAFWKKQFLNLFVILIVSILSVTDSSACTGITLKAKDGAVIFGRTQEWGTFDLNSRLVIIPRGYEVTTTLPDGQKGISFKGKYGLIGIDAVNKDIFIDGMNEKGLTGNLFYHEGFAQYPEFNPSKASESIPVMMLAPYLLMTCENTKEVKEALAKIQVVGVKEEVIGAIPPIHFMFQDEEGQGIVVEFTKGKTVIYDAPLGVITNGPDYNWHTTNLLNYVDLDQPLPHRHIKDIKSLKFGAGSRLYGLPGDLTSPSRFLRAAAYVNTSRETPDGSETMYELFRILDNFNLTVGTAAEGGGEVNQDGMRSSTIWTTAYDTKNKIMQYHTMHNRRIRQVNFDDIDFNSDDIVRIPLDRIKSEDIEQVIIPGKKALAGGWSKSTVTQTVQDAVDFLLARMNTTGKLKKILDVKSQVVNGTNYDITFELDNNTKWNAIIYRNRSGQFSITKVTNVK